MFYIFLLFLIFIFFLLFTSSTTLQMNAGIYGESRVFPATFIEKRCIIHRRLHALASLWWIQEPEKGVAIKCWLVVVVVVVMVVVR